MKYDSQLIEVQKILPTAQNILVALPADPDMDQLAAGLTLFLSLQQAGKNAEIVTSGTINVGHTVLFGVGQIRNQLPPTQSGDLIITLSGVVATDAEGKPTVPALEKLDYYPEGSDLNLVFRVLPGQKFEPTAITPKYQSNGFDLIFIIGAPALTALGSTYNTQTESFSGAHIVNIDKTSANTQFGSSNIVDPAAASVSEMMVDLLPALQLPFEGDIATNALTGIFAATSDLTSPGSSADTFMAVASALRAGGQKPGSVSTAPAAAAPTPVQEQPQITTTPQAASTSGALDNFTVPQVVADRPVGRQDQPASPDVSLGGPAAKETQPIAEEQPSPEEVPGGGEGEEAITPELDWLIPKIYKGGSSRG